MPLYYQLQEVLKEKLESGLWRPGDAIPSEPELARMFSVSRVVVRQALGILEDDRQIVRIRGRGTFVAQPKLDYRAGGLSRLLAAKRGADVAVHVLDKRRTRVERSIRDALAAPREDVFRLTTLFSIRSVPLAISYSFFRDEDVRWLDGASRVGRNIPLTLLLGDYGVELAHSELSIETSQCGQFEADRFGIPHRSSVFLVLCTEFQQTVDGPWPFEVARVEYRGDLLQFRLEVLPDSERAMAATWTFAQDAPGVANVLA